MQITGDFIKAKRAQLGLSREKFAQRVGLTPGAVWRIEAKNQFKPGEVEQLATALDGDLQTPVEPINQPTPQVTTVTLEDPPEDALPIVLSYDEFKTNHNAWGTTDFSVGWTTSGGVASDYSVESGFSALSLPVMMTTTVAPPVLPMLPGADVSPTIMSEHDGFRRISNSEVQAAKDCPRKWWLAYYRRLQPKTESSIGARAIGDRLHRALRYGYLGDASLRISPRQALEALITLDRAAFATTFDPDDPFHIDTKRRFDKEADLERIMLEGYEAWLAETGADSEFEIIGSEVYLEADLPDLPNIKIIARLDARVRRISDNVRLFIDHKSVGDFTRPTRTLHMDEQMLLYMLIEQLQENDDTRVAGALYNMLKRVKRTGTAKPPFYQRIEVHHNPIELESFRRRLMGTVQNIERMRARLDVGEDHRIVAYPRPTQDCTWKCPFFQVCSMFDDGSHVEGMIKEFYNVGDPLGYYVKDNK